MQEESSVLFREEQRPERWFRPVFAIMGVMCSFMLGQAAVWILAAKFNVSNATSYTPWIIAVFMIFYMYYAVVMIPRMFRLVTEVKEDGIYVQFGRTPFRFIPLDGITSFEVAEHKLAQGTANVLQAMRTNTRKGNIYRITGDKGVRIKYEDGKEMFIGSQKPEELVEAIRLQQSSSVA